VTDPIGLPATELAALIRSGAAEPIKVTEAHLERIEALDHDIGAFVLVRAAGARQEAAALARRPDLATLPLAGVPVAVKDSEDVAGAPTRFGSAATSARPAAADGDLARRLRAAGAVIVGKTNLPELGIWPVTEPLATGPTRNPWDPARTPGGSSGGSAAAVAAGMVPLAFGSDGGGSVRIPAACCGLVGLKPGRGVVPRPPGVAPPWFGLVEPGPLATTVADAALALDVLAGAGPRNRGPAPPERRLRVAVSIRTPVPWLRAGPEPVAAMAAVAELLAGLGHTVEAAEVPWPRTLEATFAHRWLVGVADGVAGLDRAALEPSTRRQARVGELVDRLAPVRSGPGTRIAAWRALAAAWFAAGGPWDVLLTPALGRAPVPLGAWAGRGLAATFALATAFAPFTAPWNLAGFPSLAVPAPHDGLPVGALLTGPAGSEPVLLALAAELEAAAPWPRHAPAPDRA
jgi:amidase